MIEVVSDTIDVGAVLAAVQGPDAGAVVLFLGTVRERTGEREVRHLDYEAYGPMARSELESLAAEARRDHGAARVAIVHRTGHLELGETAVAIAVSAPHRPAAFDACRWLIDALKQRVPIWKKEQFADGSEWVSDRP